MSKKTIESVLGKAILDNEFRNALFAFPDDALADFDLSVAEKNMLKRVDSETLELLANIIKPHFARKVLNGEAKLAAPRGTTLDIKKLSNSK